MTWDDETKARAAGMKRAGMTNKQIAERLGCTLKQAIHICGKMKAYRRLDHRTGSSGGAPVRSIGVNNHETVDDLP
jgi:transposase